MLTCKFEKGYDASLRHAVVDAVIVRNKEILLTRRADRLSHGGKWCLPGGFIDRDETTTEAVVREVHEEIGYTCSVKDLFTIVDKPNRGEDRQNISFIFEVELIEKVGEIDPEEVAEMQWFRFDELPSQADFAMDHFEIIWQYIDQHGEVLDS